MNFVERTVFVLTVQKGRIAAGHSPAVTVCASTLKSTDFCPARPGTVSSQSYDPASMAVRADRTNGAAAAARCQRTDEAGHTMDLGSTRVRFPAEHAGAASGHGHRVVPMSLCADRHLRAIRGPRSVQRGMTGSVRFTGSKPGLELV